MEYIGTWVTEAVRAVCFPLYYSVDTREAASLNYIRVSDCWFPLLAACGYVGVQNFPGKSGLQFRHFRLQHFTKMRKATSTSEYA